MSQDDTFRVLSRPTFDEMFDLHRTWWEDRLDDDRRKRIPFMEQHGWTWAEFVLTAKKGGWGFEV